MLFWVEGVAEWGGHVDILVGKFRVLLSPLMMSLCRPSHSPGP